MKAMIKGDRDLKFILIHFSLVTPTNPYYNLFIFMKNE